MLSLLRPLLFLLCINDLTQAMKFCKIHNFADDTNLLCVSNSIKKLNKLVNAELKYPVTWLSPNKISFNAKKLKWSSLILSKRNLNVIQGLRILFFFEIRKYYFFLHKVMEKPYLNLHFKFQDFFPWNNEDMKICSLGFFFFPNINQFS